MAFRYPSFPLPLVTVAHSCRVFSASTQSFALTQPYAALLRFAPRSRYATLSFSRASAGSAVRFALTSNIKSFAAFNPQDLCLVVLGQLLSLAPELLTELVRDLEPLERINAPLW